MPQIKIESNLPIIFLTLMVIGITVFMIFEFRKVNHRINQIVSMLNNDNKGDKKSPKKQEKIDSNEKVEEWREENDVKQNIVNGINHLDQEEQNVVEEEDDMPEEYINTNVFSTMLMSQGMVDRNERQMDIEEIEGEDDNQYIEDNEHSFEDDGGEETHREQDEESDREESDNEESDREESDREESDREESDNEEEDEESDEDIILDLKGISENTDFEKEKIMVDDTFSASQLRQLCKNMGLSVSGNKTKLISRIMEYQK